MEPISLLSDFSSDFSFMTTVFSCTDARRSASFSFSSRSWFSWAMIASSSFEKSAAGRRSSP
eukprot:5451225-Pyramimonas_sp.AAC.2